MRIDLVRILYLVLGLGCLLAVAIGAASAFASDEAVGTTPRGCPGQARGPEGQAQGPAPTYSDSTELCFPLDEAAELLACVEQRAARGELDAINDEIIDTLMAANRALAEQVSALEEELNLTRIREHKLAQQVLGADRRAGAWDTITNWLRFGAGVAVGGGALYLGAQIAQED